MRIQRIFLWLNILFLSGCTAIFGACTSNWDEEVMLSDGRTIIIERSVVRQRGGGELASGDFGSRPKLYTIKFRDPDPPFGLIEWQSTKFSETWPEYPLVLDKEQGGVVVYSRFKFSKICKYIYTDGRWEEELLPSRIEAIATNLLISDYDDRPRTVTLEIKRRRNSDVGYKRNIKVGPEVEPCI